MNYVRFMQYQLFIDEKVYDHFRCTDCKRTYLHEESSIVVCYTHTRRQLFPMKIHTLNMYYINRLVVCDNCSLLVRKESVISGICPVCTCGKLNPLMELMKL